MLFDPALERFSGDLPLFPLPRVVLFPGTKIPLQVFEPRYRQMVADAERADRLIGLVLLRGAEASDSGKSDIHEVACLGQMRHVQLLPDGRYLLQLVGLRRAKIRRELSTGTPYRMAQVELLEDFLNPLENEAPTSFAESVMESFNRVLRDLTDLPGNVLSIRKEVPPGLLIDVMSYYLPSEAIIKQRLLEETDVYRRGRMLMQILEEVHNALPHGQTARLRIFPRPSKN